MDITTDVDDLFLKKYDLEPDNAYSVDDNKRTIFDDIRSTCFVQVGGSVTNTIRTVRAVRGSPKGLTYLGTIGDDVYGETIKTQLEKEGLGGNLTTVRGSTGKVAVLLRDQSRTLVTDLGVSTSFSLDNNICRIIDAASLVYLSGFFISVSPETISRLAEKNKMVAFNLGAPFLCSKFPKEMILLFKTSSIVFGNEMEYRALGKLHNITSKHLKEIVMATNEIHTGKPRVIVITRGGRSVLVFQENNWLEFEVESVNEEVVDSNGAGDAFVGGFLARYIDGENIATCVSCGIRFARKIIQSVGFNPYCNSIL